MNDDNSVLLSRLVVGHKRDGRCQYDPAAKQELVRQCKLPGVSVSRLAMQHGINANLLRVWIAKSLLPDSKDVQLTTQAKKPDALPAFVAVQTEPRATPALTGQPTSAERVPRSSPPPTSLRLHVSLPNGVGLEIDGARADELLPVMQFLSTLTCSS